MPSKPPPTRRLAPCFCGSGRRYKDCHGAIKQARESEAINQVRALREAGDHSKATAIAKDLLAQEPADADVLDLLGMLSHDCLRLEEAKEYFERALQLRPESPSIHTHLSFVLLLLGQYKSGWREFSWRTKIPGPANFSNTLFGMPRWTGQSVAGARVLIHAEQGLGDTIQFARFLPLLSRAGADQVDLFCHAPLVSLLSRIEGVKTVTADLESRPTHNFHMPLGDLAAANLPDQAATHWHGTYISSRPEHKDKWRRRLSLSPGPRIGLVWKGNPLHVNDRNRSLTPQMAASLVGADSTYVSLQVPPQPRLDGPPNLMQLGDEISDWEDTAAIVDCLDLLISVDTSVAHLAGAMGKPVMMLLPYCSDWRWGLERSDSPWYPSMRLFRQQSPGDWRAPIESVNKTVSELMRQKAALGSSNALR